MNDADRCGSDQKQSKGNRMHAGTLADGQHVDLALAHRTWGFLPFDALRQAARGGLSRFLNGKIPKVLAQGVEP